MRRVFTEDGITVVEERAVAATASDVGVAVTTASGIRVEGQQVLVATGRRPDTTALNLSPISRGRRAPAAHRFTVRSLP